MLYLITRLMVNAAALVLTAWLLPGINVVQHNWITYMLLAVAVSLINTYIRPVILLFTGQYVIATMGAALFVINGLLLLFAAWLFPNRIVVDGLFIAIIAGVIMTFVTIGLEFLLGLTQPVSDSTNHRTPAWYGFDRIPYGGRNRFVENLRIQQVYNTFYRYMLDIALDRGTVADFRRRMQRRFYTVTGHDGSLTVAAKIRVMLQELGPIYVKMGQIIASQAQALPKTWHQELTKLQSSVPPFPADEAWAIVSDELGAPPDQLFRDFEAEPFAAASTAQVHKARTLDGTPVVVKVQRPNITTQVSADLGIMQDVADTLEKRTSWATEYNLAGMISEYSTGVLKELNYLNEAYNAAQLARNMAVFDSVHVPQIYFDLSTSRVMTMEFVSGVKISSTDAIDGAGLDRKSLADTFVRSVVKQIVIDGFFHADPHPGNVLVDLDTGVIQFIDLGMMGNLDREQRMYLADLILSIYTADFRDLGHVILSLSTPFKPVNTKAFVRDLEAEMGRYLMVDESNPAGLGEVMNATLELMHRHGLRLNQELTLALKAIMQAEEAALALDPTVDMVKVAVSEANKQIVDQFNAENIADVLTKEGLRSAKMIVRRIPTLSEATMKWLDQYESGKFTVHLDTSDLAQQVGQFSIGVRYLTAGLVLMGLMIGTAVATNVGVESWSLWLPLARLLFLGALLLSVFLVIRIVRSLP